VRNSINDRLKILQFEEKTRPHLIHGYGYASLGGLGGLGSLSGLLRYDQHSQKQRPNRYPVWEPKYGIRKKPTWRVPLGLFGVAFGLFCVARSDCRMTTVCGWGCGIFGVLLVLTGYKSGDEQQEHEKSAVFQHNSEIVQHKLLDFYIFSLYSNSRGQDMANVLNMDKQIMVIGALAEGSSIRSIERMTGVHRDTVMRLGVKVGQGCTRLMDESMRNLPCTRLEMDEIWGFIGKKDKHVRIDDDPTLGNVWTFCAIDADTKLVPAFKCGDRSEATAKAFVADVASRMKLRLQISTDGLKAYTEAIESAFGADVDYGQIIKTYGVETSVESQRRYSAPSITAIEKKRIAGNPDFNLISTSYVERLNATTRLHMRRLTRLTLAFSKKRENFEAAVGLHFAYYNFVKRHNTLRCTPAMAAEVTPSFWSVGDLLEAAA
jgi:IS1 family transposase